MFSSKTKNTIDTVVPILVGFGVWYYYCKPQKMDIRNTAIYVGVATLVSYLVVSGITKSKLERSLEIQDKEFALNGGGSAGGGSSFTITIDPVKYSTELHEDIAGLRGLSANHNLYQRLSKMSSQNLAAVAQQYERDWGESLYSAMDGESYPNLFNGTQDLVNGIMNRLKELGL